LQAAKQQHQQANSRLVAIAQSLRRTDANIAATRYTAQLRLVVDSVLGRKQQLLQRALQGRQLLEQLTQAAATAAASAGALVLDQKTDQKVASAMAAVSSAQDGDVTYLEVTDRGVTVVPEHVEVDFGVMLVASEPQQRFLRILNATCSPLQLQLLDEQGAPSASSTTEGPAGDLSQAIKVPKTGVVVGPGQQNELQLIASSCEEAGTATITYNLSCISVSSCRLVKVVVAARYEQLSVCLDRHHVDFGAIASYTEKVQQPLFVTNNTGGREGSVAANHVCAALGVCQNWA
jgi:hypothetical protein